MPLVSAMAWRWWQKRSLKPQLLAFPCSEAPSHEADAARCSGHMAVDVHGLRSVRIPTQRGDVLILLTLAPASYAIATVTIDGQQDFGAGYNVMKVPDFALAMKQARALALPGCRIYLVNVDTGEWTGVSDATSG